jgi:uncharacterized protein YjbI with pentapeptide repeats
MSTTFFEDKIFRNSDFSETGLPGKEFERCTFIQCNFSACDFSEILFSECQLDNCDFSLVSLNNTALQEIKFINCKMLGLRFDYCNPFLFAVQFENCVLNFSSFYKMQLKNTRFSNCMLHEVEFTETNLTGASFDECDLSGVVFENTNLEKADFRLAANFSIHPEINRINQARFSSQNLAGLLYRYNIRIE